MTAIIIAFIVIGFFLLHSGMFDRFQQDGAVTAHVIRVEPENNVKYYAYRTSADRTSYRIHLAYYKDGKKIEARSDRSYPMSRWMPGDEVQARPFKKDPNTVYILSDKE